MTLIDMLLRAHIAAGIVALATFLVPMVTAKGGRAHRRVGWVFVGAMGVLCFTGVPVSAYRMFADPRPGAQAIASFLLFITLFSGSATWMGIRVLRAKGPERRANFADLALAATVAITGLLTFYQGLRFGSPVLMFFGPFGVWTGFRDFRYWLNPNKPKMHWFFEHMSGMIGSSVAALTAFSALGSRALGLPVFGALAWIGPTVIFVPISILMARHYRRKFRLDGATGSAGAPARPIEGRAVMA